MTGRESLARLEARQDEERAAARRRLEAADEMLQLYRREIRRVQEAFYEHAEQRGVGGDPGFRSGFQRVLEHSDDLLRAGQNVVDEQAEDLDAMVRRQDDEREDFIAEQRSHAW